MFGHSTPDEFRFYFPKGFLDDSVRKKFKNYAVAVELPYADMIDYINASVVDFDMSGLKDSSSVKQNFDKGREKSFKGSRPVEEGIAKELEVTCKLGEACINWFMLREQLASYLAWDRSPEKNFLPPVYLQMLDEEDRIILEVVMTYVRFTFITDIKLSVQDNGIISKDFTVGLTYNKIEYKYNMDKIA